MFLIKMSIKLLFEKFRLLIKDFEKKNLLLFLKSRNFFDYKHIKKIYFFYRKKFIYF